MHSLRVEDYPIGLSLFPLLLDNNALHVIHAVVSGNSNLDFLLSHQVSVSCRDEISGPLSWHLRETHKGSWSSREAG